MRRLRSTLEQWRILQTVVEAGGYAQAAETLNRSHSSLNHAVAKLQDQLGISLLEVRGRKAHLTPAGKVMLQRAKHLLEEAALIEDAAANLKKGVEEEIKIVLERIYPRDLMTQCLSLFYEHYPDTRVRIFETTLSESQTVMESENADLGIMSFTLRGYLSEPLGTYRLICVAVPDHPLFALDQDLTGRELASFRQVVLMDKGKGFQHIGWLRAKQSISVTSAGFARSLVLGGDAFGWLPEFMIEDHLAKGQLMKLPLIEGGNREVALSLTSRGPDLMGPAVSLFRELLLGQAFQSEKTPEKPLVS